MKAVTCMWVDAATGAWTCKTPEPWPSQVLRGLQDPAQGIVLLGEVTWPSSCTNSCQRVRNHWPAAHTAAFVAVAGEPAAGVGRCAGPHAGHRAGCLL
jgi:hypothetical protein